MASADCRGRLFRGRCAFPGEGDKHADRERNDGGKEDKIVEARRAERRDDPAENERADLHQAKAYVAPRRFAIGRPPRNGLRQEHCEIGRRSGDVGRPDRVPGRHTHDRVLEAAYKRQNTKENEVLVGFDRLPERPERALVPGDRDDARNPPSTKREKTIVYSPRSFHLPTSAPTRVAIPVMCVISRPHAAREDEFTAPEAMHSIPHAKRLRR